MQTTGKQRSDVDGKGDFPTVFASLVARVEAVRVKYSCDGVVCVGYNWLSTDHAWLLTMCLKHHLNWPSTWEWGWDPYRSITYVVNALLSGVCTCCDAGRACGVEEGSCMNALV